MPRCRWCSREWTNGRVGYGPAPCWRNLGCKIGCDHRPDQLSGGEAQRVAIARALINNPKIILADEPTGNLDRETGAHVMELLQKINRERGVTVLMVTHDERAAGYAQQIIRIEKGELA